MLHILVIDDEPSVLSLIAAELRDAGDRVTPVASAQEALKALSQARFDLIITDLGVGPDKTLIQQYRELAPDSRILMFSGWVHGDDRSLRDAWGVDACLAKPASPEELHAAIQALFPSARDAKAGSLE